MEVKKRIKHIIKKLNASRMEKIPGLKKFRELAAQADQRFLFREEDLYPCLNDNTGDTPFDRHYIYHPAWAARTVKIIDPDFHIDISSTLSFSSMLSAFIPVKFYDYRPAHLELTNLISGKEDLTRLSFPSNSIFSLSCMHTVEHIGLGRYGDPLNYDGDLLAVAELARVIAPSGNLLFVVPIAAIAHIRFNAHRIYTKQLVIAMFAVHHLVLKEFTLIPDDKKDGGAIADPPDELLAGQKYACGCFWFVKPANDNS